MLRHCFSHSTERTVRLEFDNSQRLEREGEKETQDSSKSEAEHLNDMLQRATLARAELMDDVDTIQRMICPPNEVNKNPASMQKEIGTSIVNRDTKAITAVIDAATFTSVNGQKWVDLVRGRAQATTRLRGGRPYRETTTVVKHCGASAGAVH